MKIENTTMTPVDAGQATWSKPGQGAGTSFSDVLAKAVSGDGLGTTSTGGSAPVAGVGRSIDAGMPPLWGQVDGLLTALDNYATALGDSSKSLKELEPLTQELEQRADALDAGLSGAALSGQAQDDLTTLAVQAVTQARVEAFKFRRGDYL